MLSFSLEWGAVDGPIPPFHSGLAHHASLWPLLNAERPSSRPAELPLLGAESILYLKCVMLESSIGQAYCAAALSWRRRSGPLVGSDCWATQVPRL